MPPQTSEDTSDKVFMDESPPEQEHKITVAGRIARFTARHPLACLLGTLAFATLISALGIILGDFDVSVDNKGWRSRGTLIANREMQNEVLRRYKRDLFKDTDGSLWEEVENNVAYGYVPLDARDDEDDTDSTSSSSSRRNRKLFVDGCDAEKYYTNMLAKDNLFAAYKTDASAETTSKSILDPDVLFEICEAETATNQALKDNGVCGGCPGSNDCLPPFSLLLILRLQLGALDTTCAELKEKYTQDVQQQFTDTLLECTQEVKDSYDSTTQTYDEPTKCPPGFQVTLVDTSFGVNGNRVLRHSSSYFITYETKDKELYDVRPEYAYTDESIVTTVYDTLREVQNEFYVESLLVTDMSLAVGSLIITFTAMGIHTKSFWLTLMGVFQIIYSVPLSYFVYHFIAGLKFFPFLNFIGVFVAAALGADDVFVAVDKWKNARIQNPSATTQDVAAMALPDAASAMLLTTSTTAVAFFATTICPVTPILCFALFCALLILFNYFMNILLVFPALCLYDIWLMNGNRNCLINFGCCSKAITDRGGDSEGETDAEANKSPEDNPSLIYRILSFYFNYLKKFRYFVLAACLAATAICIWVALTIKLPDSVDVRLLPENHEYELHFAWKQKLLSFPFFFSGGSKGEITWGLLAKDTGKKNDPDSLTTIELDENFNPRTTEAQTYLVEFCDKLFATDIANPLNEEYVCPINKFDSWLRNQTDSDSPEDIYLSKCNNADSIPMSEDHFDSCFIAWSELAQETNVLEKKGKIVVLRMRAKQLVGWDAPFPEMDEYWNKYEDWMQNERDNAPAGVNNMFHTSFSFWWYDTNTSMLQTAIGAAGIAIGFSAVVVLLSSRSLALTLFSGLCVTYVLAATTASLVGFGWDLGFLESICFAILIGISCDFVIHFGHAYIHYPGHVSRFVRTKHAVTHMGPSILAAAVTTFSAAIVMLFCRVIFFTKFALILLMTILHATVGSFVVYLVLTVSFGPAEPTKMVDTMFMKCKDMCGNKKDEDSNLTDTKEVDYDENKIYDLSGKETST